MDSVNVVVHPPERSVEKASEPTQLFYSDSEEANSSPSRRKWAYASTATGSLIGGILATREALDTVNSVDTSSLRDMAIGAAIPTSAILFKHSLSRVRTYREIHKVTKEKHKAKVNAETYQAKADENRAKLT